MKKLLAASVLSASLGAGATLAFTAVDARAADRSATHEVGARCTDGRGGRAARLVRAILTTSAEAIGIDVQTLRAELQDGGSIAEVARAHGVDPGVVEAALMDAARDRIDRAVERGRLDPERAAQILDRAEARIHELVAKDRPARRGAATDQSTDAVA